MKRDKNKWHVNKAKTKLLKYTTYIIYLFEKWTITHKNTQITKITMFCFYLAKFPVIIIIKQIVNYANRQR